MSIYVMEIFRCILLMNLVDLTRTHTIKQLKEFVKAYIIFTMIVFVILISIPQIYYSVFDEKMVPKLLHYGFSRVIRAEGD